ncbi:MAG: heme NO-binding protein [Phycisphaerae bacterium]|nr:heme NO-binding protein [Phycisphaerae bacterium]
MYGLINIAIKDLVTEDFGEEAWHRILSRAGLEGTEFILMDQYEDSVTYDLVGAAAEELDVPASQILQSFGAYWTKYTAVKGYGPLLDSAGKTFPEFLQNLDLMHTRVGTMFPDFVPPSFECHNMTEHSLDLHYISEREGLEDLVIGLLHGLAERFELTLEIIQDESKSEQTGASIFHLKWT